MLSKLAHHHANKTFKCLSILELLGLFDSSFRLVLNNPLKSLFQIIVGLNEGLLGLQHGYAFDLLADFRHQFDVGLDCRSRCSSGGLSKDLTARNGECSERAGGWAQQ